MLELPPAPVEPVPLAVLPVPVPAPLAVPVLVPVLPPVVPVPDVAAPVVDPPAIVPMTSTRCPTYCFRFWLSPAVSR
jgi:hypothetical protein